MQFPAPNLTGPENVAIEEVPQAKLRYQVRLPFDAHPQDPQLRVRWTVRRSDSGKIVLNADNQAAFGREITLDSAAQELFDASQFRIECRVYQVFGATATDLFAGSTSLKVLDRLDRSHAFVRWTHEVRTPSVRVEANGTHTILGIDQRSRRSNLHRTEFPGRCRMVSFFSLKVDPTSVSGSSRPHLEYLDALPFPRSDLITRRREVCDYCFFGGPTKKVPLIP
jgi:hypothetical protein